MDAPLTPDSVRAALEDTSSWDRLDDAGIARLAHHAIFFAGRGHAAVDTLLGAFYPEYVKRVAAEGRQQIFARVRSLVHETVVVGSVLPCFLCHDPDAGIASTAARDIASSDLIEAASGARGPDYVLKLVITGAVANPGAALGGLLALGEEAVNAKLVALRSALALKWADRALGAMASAPTGYVLAATVEFWLHWLESLAGDLPGTARVFEQAARALAVQREAIIEPVVLRNRRPGAGGTALEVPLAEFTRSIAPRLRVLARLAHGSEGFGRVLVAWLGENGAPGTGRA
jgi:hypothetical protein